MAGQAFISYASSDAAVAERICNALETAGISCWIAPRNIPAGVDYPKAIVEAVKSATVFVLILTDHAAASRHVLSEVGHAFNDKKRIIPFRISRQPLPEDLEYFLSLPQWLDAPDGCTDQNLKQLVEATLAAVAGKPIPRPERPAGVRRKWVAGAASLVIIVGAILALLEWRRRYGPDSTKQPTAVGTPGGRPTTLTVGTEVKSRVNAADQLKYVWIPAGTFTMGCSVQDDQCSDDEKPAHQVEFAKGFWLGQTEVTVSAYRKIAPTPSQPALNGDGNLPISGVSWEDAKRYCAAVGSRLPTETEWEYGARGGNPQPYYGTLSQIAWYAGNSGDSPHPVGEKQPNAFGLYDMLGNVSEWVLDRYFDKYSLDVAAMGPTVEEPLPANALAIARGGFWESDAPALRVSHRAAQEKDGGQIPIGFRCASDRP